MYSPGKYQGLRSTIETTNFQQFKQETILLLKQQSQKLKRLNAQISTKQQQLMIKDQQINFLKESIKQIQNENQNLLRGKNDMESKLTKIVEQIQSYNENVVKPICEQKQNLKKYCMQLRTSNQNLEKSIQQKNNLNAQIQKSIGALIKDIQNNQSLVKQNQIKSFQLQHKLSKSTALNQKLKQENIKLNSLLLQQQGKKQRLQNQASTLVKQLNDVINKHNSSVKDYEHKIKQILANKVDLTQILVYKELVKTQEKQIHTLKNQLFQNKKNNEQLKSYYLESKQKTFKDNLNIKNDLQQLRNDLLSLTNSIQLNKKIAEFQSSSSDNFYSILEKYQKLNQDYVQIKQNLQDLQQNYSKLQRENLKVSTILKDNQLQQLIFKNQFHSQLQRLQSSYQGKLLSLNLKIKTEQQALQRLKKTQLQAVEENQKLSFQLQTIQTDFNQYRQTTDKSLGRLNKENYEIVNQMQQLYQICEQNVNHKRTVDKIKHVVHALLTGLHYCQLKLVRERQKQRKLYIPFIQFFLTFNNMTMIENPKQQKSNAKLKNVQSCQSKRRKRKNFSINRLRSYVWVVIATLRIKSNCRRRQWRQNELISKSFKYNQKENQGSSLQPIAFKVLSGIQKRNKIHNTGQVLQMQKNIMENNQQVNDIICALLSTTSKTFSWTQANYRQIQIKSFNYFQKIEKIKSNQICKEIIQ